MKTLLRIFIFIIMVCWLTPTGIALPSDSILNREIPGSVNSYPAENNATIHGPVLPPFYLINKENGGQDTLTDTARLQFVFVQPNRLVPRNFRFGKDLSLTTIIRDHDAPVPLFIRGHALLH